MTHQSIDSQCIMKGQYFLGRFPEFQSPHPALAIGTHSPLPTTWHNSTSRSLIPSLTLWLQPCIFPDLFALYACAHFSCACMLSCLSRVQLFATLWTVALQAPLSMGFSRQEYWRGLPCPPPTQKWNLLLTHLPALAGKFFTTSAA